MTTCRPVNECRHREVAVVGCRPPLTRTCPDGEHRGPFRVRDDIRDWLRREFSKLGEGEDLEVIGDCLWCMSTIPLPPHIQEALRKEIK